MTKRIFRSIFLVALVVLLLSVALLSVVFYNDYAVQYRSELKSEALSMAHAINGGLAEEDYLRSLEQDKISQIRITWIGADGTVRYDNEAAPAQMENHAARTEVADALRYGAGESERYSATLSRKTFYYACRLQDGTVLRLAGTRDSVLGILVRMLRLAVAAVLVAIALAWLLSYRLSKRIVRPLNALDLEHPEQAEAYDELSPLLEKISAQNRQIAAQMDELRRRQTEFTAITEHMNEGLLIVDARTNLLFCNPSARRLLQIENVEKQSVLAVNRSEDFREAVQRALSGEHDLRTLTLDGRIYQLMANPAMEDGRLAGAVLVLLDVTEREDREQLRREFTANVSHELRTPLTSIITFAQISREACDPGQRARPSLVGGDREEQPYPAQHDQQHAGHRAFGCGRAWRATCEPMDLGDVAASVKGTMAPLARKYEVSFSTKVASDVPLSTATTRKRRACWRTWPATPSSSRPTAGRSG